MKKNHPELLAPAGSPEALAAAVAAGADAVYFGGSSFNARMNAKNFSGDSLADAFRLCRDAGVKTNVTVNTLVGDREMYPLLRSVEELYLLGADALIVADLGAASLIHSYFPELELHASTQAAGHNSLAAVELQKLGFSRMVAARELSAEDIAFLCQNSPLETEIFIHGAICVSQSGQCLASSLIGGRSGNRGECAQPCRLPYKNESGKSSYALSLKDMCLAEHIPELLRLGAASFKLEGRMKPPDYVYGVTSIYRRLIDEERSASPDELAELKRLFSRSGFTDGYFTKKISRAMLGVRTDSDKRATASKAPARDYSKLADARVAAFAKTKLLDADIEAVIEPGKPVSVAMSSCGKRVVCFGQTPEPAKSCPLDESQVAAKLSKLGGTRFRAGKVGVRLGEGLMLPVSALNSLRREAVERLSGELGSSGDTAQKREPRLSGKLTPPELNAAQPITARVEFPERCGLSPGDEFDIVFVPLEKYRPGMSANGVIIPPVVFDSETAELRAMLETAKNAGIKHALVSNLGHIALAQEAGMTLHGDYRLNIYNRWTAKVLLDLGFTDLMASPELTLPQLRSLGLPAIVYGRIPLMTLEKCCIRELYSCAECAERGFLPLVDRMGAVFPLTRAWKHRNILYNSVPVYMADRKGELSAIKGRHFIFTDEKPEKILEAYRLGLPADFPHRRIKS